MKIHDLKTGSITEYNNIHAIIVYGNGVKQFESENHCFQEYRDNGRGIFSDVYDGKIIDVFLSSAPVRALKENLKRKDNYFIKYSGQYSWETGVNLYIHESEINVISLGEKLAHENEREKNYLHGYHLKFVHGATVRRLHAERIPGAGPKWTIPDGGRWSDGYGSIEKPCYNTFKPFGSDETQVIKRWSTLETIHDIDTAARYYCRTEHSDAWKECRKIADYCNEKRVFYKDVSAYEIENLLKHFKVEKKQ